MKTRVFILASMLMSFIAFGQNLELKEIEVTPPVFKSEVPNTIVEYLQKRVVYPQSEIKWRTQGTVVIEFTVTPEGKLKNYEIIHSVSNEIDNEVIRVLKSTEGMWLPGMINGEIGAMQKEVTVEFKLNPHVDFIEDAKKYLQKGNLALFIKGQPEKALKYFNMGINLLPNDETLLAVRGLCKYKMGDETGATRDWDRSVLIAKRNGTSDYIENMLKIQAGTPDIDEFLRALRE
jgi:TonB family protein